MKGNRREKTQKAQNNAASGDVPSGFFGGHFSHRS
jgi:hypothetical protein